MKSYIKKEFLNLEKKIIKRFESQKKNELSAKILINYLIYLNLKTEVLVFTKDHNPEVEILNEIKYLYSLVNQISTFKEFASNKVKIQNFILEKNHQSLFEKLWINYTFKEFKRERLGRYTKRIKINKLQKFIKNKKIVDFGCGHGNFLMSMLKFKPKECVGIDYGKRAIEYANKFKKKYFSKHKISFFTRSVYKSKLKKDYFDLAIQNGVFHHLENENKAYKEVHRVLNTGGHFWIYTTGGGGIKDFIWRVSQKLLQNIDNDVVQNQIRTSGFTVNKEYLLGDGLSAKYRRTDLKAITLKLDKIGFKFVKQLNGGYKTDFDFPYRKDKFFRKKFGSGDLRLLFKKV